MCLFSKLGTTVLCPESAEAAFYLCAYEFAIKTVNSPWCQLFDQVDAQVWKFHI